MSLKYLFSKDGLKRMKAVTDFSDFGMQAQEGDPLSPSDSKENREGGAAGQKKGTAADAKKSPAAAGSDTPADVFPEFDPNEPNKYKVTPDCASIEMSSVLTMSQMLQYFVHAQNLDEENQFTIVIDDSQVDSYSYTEIVDLAVGLGAQYLNIKGCSKVEKFAKIARFCEIKAK